MSGGEREKKWVLYVHIEFITIMEGKVYISSANVAKKNREREKEKRKFLLNFHEEAKKNRSKNCVISS
jgi:hypothetical protein